MTTTRRLVSWIYPGISTYVTTDDATGAVVNIDLDNETDDDGATVEYGYLGDKYGDRTAPKAKKKYVVGATSENDVSHVGTTVDIPGARILLLQASLQILPSPASMRVLAASLTVPDGG